MTELIIALSLLSGWCLFMFIKHLVDKLVDKLTEISVASLFLFGIVYGILT